MDPEGTLCSQEPSIEPYAESVKYSPETQNLFLQDLFSTSIILSSITGSSKRLLFLWFMTNILYEFIFSWMHATCPTNIILFDLITLIMKFPHYVILLFFVALETNTSNSPVEV